MRKEIAIKIIDDGKYEADEEFKVMLSEPTNGAVLINANDESCFTVTTRVKVISDEETHAKVDQILADIDFDVDEPRLGGANWGSQFVEALSFLTLRLASACSSPCSSTSLRSLQARLCYAPAASHWRWVGLLLLIPGADRITHRADRRPGQPRGCCRTKLVDRDHPGCARHVLA